MNAAGQPDSDRRDRSPSAIVVDNLLRRTLRISDPRDPLEIAAALRRHYADDGAALEREARGGGFVPLLPAAIVARGGATQRESDQARGDVERDLAALSGDSALKDVEPELRGWSGSVRSAMGEGFHAARLALDPRQRDRAFSARRMLRDYARMARYVGALTPSAGGRYRALARSLDEAAALLLVVMGETLAEVGLANGNGVLLAPASELQARRDAVLSALAVLNGSIDRHGDDSRWPRGLIALRDINAALENHGYGDLRALLQEEHLSRVLDELLEQSSSMTGDGLRALAAGAQVSLQQLRRLVLALRDVGDPESPPIATLMGAINLLLDAFAAGDVALRLLYLSRPPAVFYGLYGATAPDPATAAMLELAQLRGALAEQLDCRADCSCDAAQTLGLVLLDKVLYDTDQSVDLIVQGGGRAQDYLHRASGYAPLVASIAGFNDGAAAVGVARTWQIPPPVVPTLRAIHGRLSSLVGNRRNALAADELCHQLATEHGWARLARSMAPGCRDPHGVAGVIASLLESVIRNLGHDPAGCIDTAVDIPAPLETSMEGLISGRERDGSA